MDLEPQGPSSVARLHRQAVSRLVCSEMQPRSSLPALA